MEEQVRGEGGICRGRKKDKGASLNKLFSYLDTRRNNCTDHKASHRGRISA